ncbi:MAG: hypothetical protein QXO32_06825 [Candidatus Bathyarchaeia archaeon]|nr:hypothetical protein [Candidatus Bathyarchaeota archaeon]
MPHLKKALILLMMLSISSWNIYVASAAPSGTIDPPVGEVDPNVLELGDDEWVIVTFKNSAGASLTDVASTIQYITLAAADLNPTRAQIDLTASWEIYSPDNLVIPRASGTVMGSVDLNAIYSPYSTTDLIYLYTWELGSPSGTLSAYTDPNQFASGLKVLRPQEILKLKVTIKCQKVVGDSIFWFFFKATEAHYTAGNYPTDINSIDAQNRMNLYYSKLPGPDQTKYWLPLHNSYDPYDADIGTGHNFEQHSWTRGSTIHAFAKANKLAHQKPKEDPEDPQGPYSFHICGIKFDDSNRNGLYDAEIEKGINDVTVILLGPDQKTLAEEYYPGMFEYPPPEGNPLLTGENMLRGSYCFNLENVDPKGGIDKQGTYEFWVKIEEPTGREATTPTLIGPIILKASPEGPREKLDIHFGNSPPTTRPPIMPSNPVGGIITSVNKLAIIAPYLVLVGLAGALSTLTIVRRRRKA